MVITNEEYTNKLPNNYAVPKLILDAEDTQEVMSKQKDTNPIDAERTKPLQAFIRHILYILRVPLVCLKE